MQQKTSRPVQFELLEPARANMRSVCLTYGFGTAIALLAILYVFDLVALLLLIPERRSAPLF